MVGWVKPIQTRTSWRGMGAVAFVRALRFVAMLAVLVAMLAAFASRLVAMVVV